MNFHIITLFPHLIDSYMGESIMGRAQKDGRITVATYNPRDFTDDAYKRVDDEPYGGGPGMVLKAEPILKTVDTIQSHNKKILLFSPHGTQFTNDYADKLIQSEVEPVLISGRYEGIDARAEQALDAELISIGPYVLTGGELPALVLIDAVTRRLPGVLGTDASVEERRVAGEGVYTRPETFSYKGKEYRVPEVLLSGHHQNIERFRQKPETKN